MCWMSAGLSISIEEARFKLGLCKGEELTSVAFHLTLDLFAAVIDAGNKPGRLEIRSASTGALIDRVVVGFGPDAAVFYRTESCYGSQ